ncbi:MAG: lysylphosphatidylglycerol synthase transmembrane domain-containing protein [Bacteroidales bacterium]
MKATFKDIAKLIFFLGIGFLFIWLFVRRLNSGEKQEILLSIKNANYLWLGFAVILGVLSHVLRALRWKMLLKPIGYKPKNLNIISAVFLGYFANLAFPRLGEIIRCTILTKYEKIPFTKSFGTVITERTVDVFMFLLAFLFTFALQGKLLSDYMQERFYQPLTEKINLSIGFFQLILIITVAVVVISAIIWFLFKNKIKKHSFYHKVVKLLKGFVEGIISLFKIKRIWSFIFLSFAIWGLYFLMAYVVFFSLPSCSHLTPVTGLATLTFGTIGIILVPGGIGIYPVIVSEVLYIYGVATTQGYAMGWLIWISQNLAILVVGIFAIVLLPIINKKHERQLNANN